MPGLARPAGSASLSLGIHSPCIQDAFILRQLPHKSCIGPGDAPLLLDIVIRFLQGPAKFLHRIGYDRGCGSADAHFAMDQALGMIPSAGMGGGGSVKSKDLEPPLTYHLGFTNLIFFFFKP